MVKSRPSRTQGRAILNHQPEFLFWTEHYQILLAELILPQVLG